jgi:hypothetical protein
VGWLTSTGFLFRSDLFLNPISKLIGFLFFATPLHGQDVAVVANFALSD